MDLRITIFYLLQVLMLLCYQFCPRQLTEYPLAIHPPVPQMGPCTRLSISYPILLVDPNIDSYK